MEQPSNRGQSDRPTAVIPARYGSTRFPGKPLAKLLGRTMIAHVHARCVESGAFGRVLVATDDARVADEVRRFGGEVVMTSPRCVSGTDRVAEAAASFEGRPQTPIINVQGDEPALHPDSLRALVAAFEQPEIQMATLVRPLEERERAAPHVVKAVVGLDGFALYFSRADLPFARDLQAKVSRLAHVGLYGYRRDTLARLATLPPSPLELTEALEQLRALENGIRIACRPTLHASVAVDVPEDLPRAEQAIAALAAERKKLP